MVDDNDDSAFSPIDVTSRDSFEKENKCNNVLSTHKEDIVIIVDSKEVTASQVIATVKTIIV